MLVITVLLSFITLSFSLPFPLTYNPAGLQQSPPRSLTTQAIPVVVQPGLSPLLSISSPYVSQGPISSDTELEIRMALAQRNASGLEVELYAVSDPDSPRYGQFLTKEQVEALIAPSEDTTSAVTQWLSSNGFQSKPLSVAGDFISVNMTASQANQLLNADYTLYINKKTNETVVMTPEYSIPAELDGLVEFVWSSLLPGSDLLSKSSRSSSSNPPSSKSRKNQQIDPACLSSSGEVQVTPKCLQKIYNIPDSKVGTSRSSIGISTFSLPSNTFSGLRKDLSSFLGQFRPDLSNATSFLPVTLNIFASESDQSENTVYIEEEADLDLQYINGLASGIPTTFYDIGPSGARKDDVFLDLMNLLLGLAEADIEGLPQVLSTSFTFDEKKFDPRMAQRLCNAVAQLGARGTTVIFSSGDGGVTGASFDSDSCTDDDSTLASFVPTFPSGCPYLTSVGSVDDVVSHSASSFSSGGFSNIFPTPPFQQNAVSTYLKELGNQVDSSLFNSSGRGFPDVSLQGEYFLIQEHGEPIPNINGTSAAAPTFASMIALLNDELLRSGRSQLGWLNPWLYKLSGKVFNDVTSGSNFGCLNAIGFPALNGWDPVTGLGSPDFEKLRNALHI